MKLKHLVHIMLIGVVASDGDIMPIFIFSTWLQFQHRDQYQVFLKGVAFWLVNACNIK